MGDLIILNMRENTTQKNGERRTYIHVGIVAFSIYIQLHGVSTNEETENVMAIKPIFSNEFSEYYILYQESYSLPKYIHIKEEDIKLFKVKKYEQE